MKRLAIANLALFWFALPAAADPIEPTDGGTNWTSYHYAQVYSPDAGSAQDYYNQVGDVPLSDSRSATGARGTSTSSHVHTYDAGGAVFRRAFSQDLAAGTAQAAWSRSFSSTVFTVTEDVSYEVTGAFSATGSGDFMKLYADLYRITPDGDYVVWEDDYQYFANEVDFELGDGQRTGGSGSPTGTLSAGTYRWYTYAMVYDYNADGAAASGSGWTELTLGSPEIKAVPEPGTWALLALGGLALLGGARRKT